MIKLYEEFIKENYKFENEKYWKTFAKELSNLVGEKISLLSFEYDDYSRTIEFNMEKSKIVLTIEHSWRRDGTNSKPVTTLTANPGNYKSLGRYAIWDSPKEYAEDINGQLDHYLFEEYIEESRDFEFKIGDTAVDYNETEVKVINIVRGSSIRLKDFNLQDTSLQDTEFKKNEYYYIAKVTKDNISVGSKRGEYAIYPTEYDYTFYWGLSKIK
jgi:hypothetical protein